jgi:hypothetical protein
MSVDSTRQEDGWLRSANELSRVELEGRIGEGGSPVGWDLPTGVVEKTQWTVADAASPSLAYVDLLKNPEGFTGYSGPAAWKIWSSIYDENCFHGGGSDGTEGLCAEERAFARLLSGLHASISTHLSLNALSGGPHVKLWVERVGRWPERMRNLYFAYLVVLRAVHKAAPRLLDFDSTLASGVSSDDAQGSTLLRQLFSPPGLDPAVSGAVSRVSRAFDESGMFRVRREDVFDACPAVLSGGLGDLKKLTRKYEEAALRKEHMRDEFRGKFRNISRIMDCVGCEKCRMWGKLQFLGVGTAMKVLFDDVDGGAVVPALTRNEAVALVNVLHRLAISIHQIGLMREREFSAATSQVWVALAGALLLALLTVSAVSIWCRVQSNQHSEQSHRRTAQATAEATLKAVAERKGGEETLRQRRRDE